MFVKKCPKVESFISARYTEQETHSFEVLFDIDCKISQHITMMRKLMLCLMIFSLVGCVIAGPGNYSNTTQVVLKRSYSQTTFISLKNVEQAFQYHTIIHI